jgi:hypothetical protein
MNPLALSIIGVVGSVVSVAQTAASFGHDVKPFVDIIWNDIFHKGEPQTEAELAEITATVQTKIAELRARLQMPLPPAQDDDV